VEPGDPRYMQARRDQAERYQMNLLLFRAAYDGMSGTEDEVLVAKSRTEALNREAIERGFKSWVDRWRKMGRYWSEDSAHPNTNRPILQAWRLVSEPKEQTIHLVRNPYYYRVDSRGNQLPYIDMIHDTTVENRENMLLKMRAGKVCVVKNNFKNVPELALAGWVAHEPGSLCPEVFYFEPED
jgi:ABC-type transport system substrate-binding protein